MYTVCHVIAEGLAHRHLQLVKLINENISKLFLIFIIFQWGRIQKRSYTVHLVHVKKKKSFCVQNYTNPHHSAPHNHIMILVCEAPEIKFYNSTIFIPFAKNKLQLVSSFGFIVRDILKL